MAFLLYVIIFLFIIMVNVILNEILFRTRLDNMIFSNAEKKLKTTFSCFGNYWFVIKRTSRMLDVLYVERDNDFLTCDIEPNDKDILKSCGLNGKYNNKSNPCNITISELMFLL
jgi:hypothetical protein